MKFKYRLSVLKKLAQENERQEQLALGKLIQERISITDRLKDLSAKMSYWYQQYNVTSWDPKETGLIENHLCFIDKQKNNLIQMLRALEEKIQKQRYVVNECYKEKRKYEIHAEYKQQEFLKELITKENRETEDLVQMSFLRKRQQEMNI